MSRNAEISKSIKIIPFHGKKKMFQQWSGKFLAAARVRGYAGILTGKDKVPAEKDDLKDIDKEKIKNRANNEKAYTDLILSMEEEVCFAYVDGAKSTELPNGDAFLAWKRLNAKYRPITRQQRVSQRLDFQNSKLGSWKDDPDEWITELERKRVYLKDMGVDISDDDFILHVISNLPEEYDNVIERLEDDIDTLDIEELRDKLNVKYEKIMLRKHIRKSAKISDGEETALIMSSNRQDEKGIMTSMGFISDQALAVAFKKRCPRCGNWGHKREDCKTKIGVSSSTNSSNNSNNNSSGGKSNIKCWACGRYGHIKSECKFNKKDDSGNVAGDGGEEEVALCGFIDESKELGNCEKDIVLLNHEYDFSNIPPDVWIGDTGASCHLTNCLDGMIDLEDCSSKITVGSGENLDCLKIGTKTGKIVQKDGTIRSLKLKNVKYVPKLHCNLISLSQLLSDGKELRGSKTMMKVISENRPVLIFDRKISSGKGFLFVVKISTNDFNQKAIGGANKVRFSKNKRININLAHQLLGHPGSAILRSTAASLGWILNGKLQKCEHCAIGKAKQKNVPKYVEKRDFSPGEGWSIDISSIKNSSAGGSKYWCLWMDRSTGFKQSFFLSSKVGQVKPGVNFVDELKTKHKISVKTIRADNAGENKKLEDALLKAGHGVTFEYTAANTPQQNGAVERGFATLYGRVRSMFQGSGIEDENRQKLWAEAAQMATDLDNICSYDGKKSRYEKLFKYSPNFQNDMRIFGEMGIVLRPEPGEHHGKMKNRGTHAIFVGYSHKHATSTYRMFNLNSGRVIVTRNVQWLDKNYGTWNKEDRFAIPETEDDSDSDEEAGSIRSGREEKVDEKEKLTKLDRELKKLFTSYNPTKPIPAPDVVECAFVGGTLDGYDNPRSFQEAWNHPDEHERKMWRLAIRKEFNCMIKRRVWKHIKKRNVPEYRRLVGCVWVFKKKRNGVYRARLCAQGFSQIPGIDHKDNFSPVITDVTYRIVMVMMLLFGWVAEIVDIETAFLYGDLEEEIFMRMPQGMHEYFGKKYEDECLFLLQGIYGLVQSARQFFKKLLEILIGKMGFIKCLSDQCLLTRTDETGTTIICLYIDDTLVVGDKIAIEKFKKEIKFFFSTKEEGTMDEFVGCKVMRTGEKRMLFYQDDLIKKIEMYFGEEVKNMRKYKTPASPGTGIVRPTEDDVKISSKDQTRYRSGVGMLLYLVKFSRPDISNAVRELSKANDGATMAHFKELLRCIKYVLDTKNRMLFYEVEKSWKVKDFSNFILKMRLTAFCDSDYAGDKETRKSVTAYAIYFEKCLIAFKSRSQKTVSLSSTEAEFNAIGEVCAEIMFIKNIIEFLGITLQLPIVVNCDNVGAIYMSYNAKTSPRTKHVSIKRLFVREFVQDGEIAIKFVRSENNDSDVWSKNTSVAVFEKHTNKFMFYHDEKSLRN